MQQVDDILSMRTSLFVDINVPRVTRDLGWTSLVQRVQEHPDHTVLVVDEAGRLQGIVTDGDILKQLSVAAAAAAAAAEPIAGDVMSPLDAGTDTVAQAEEPVGDVIERLNGKNALNQRLKSMPVVNEAGTLLGQVTRASIRAGLDSILYPQAQSRRKR